MKKDVIPCKHCRLPIRFLMATRTQKWLAVDASPVQHDGSSSLVIIADGNHVYGTTNATAGMTVYKPHWLNEKCPNHKKAESGA
jgi:hypothetical protein